MKMVPKWLPGGLWATLGRRLCFQRLPGALLEKLVFGALGASWGEKLVDFMLPGGRRRVPGRLREAIFGRIFAERPGGTKKVINLIEFSLFFA